VPFTPFHMGPGLALKSVTGERFSLIMFGATQVAMDIEPGIGLLRGSEVLHGWSHTYIGATLIGGSVLLLGRGACERILKRWNTELRHHGMHWLATRDRLDWGPATLGAFVGTYSHVLLDSFMHADMRPLAPFSNGNNLLSLIPVESLHLGCVISGIAGLMLWLAVHWRKRPR
jgi:Domain of unknown function (DUF4184)